MKTNRIVWVFVGLMTLSVLGLVISVSSRRAKKPEEAPKKPMRYEEAVLTIESRGFDAITGATDLTDPNQADRYFVVDKIRGRLYTSHFEWSKVTQDRMNCPTRVLLRTSPEGSQTLHKIMDKQGE
jgi:hypothetical protein